MNHEPLEKRLRQPLKKVTPRPGFEQRFQALARQQQTPRTKSSFLWLAVPTLAAVCVLFFIMSANKKPTPSLITQSISQQHETVETQFFETSLEEALALQEALSFEKDLQRTTDFLFGALPSISISTQAP